MIARLYPEIKSNIYSIVIFVGGFGAFRKGDESDTTKSSSSHSVSF